MALFITTEYRFQSHCREHEYNIKLHEINPCITKNKFSFLMLLALLLLLFETDFLKTLKNST